MNGHTRGPWRIADEYVEPDNLTRCVIEDSTGSRVASVTDNLTSCVIENSAGATVIRRPNATLIAASPEVVEKGKALLKALGFPGGHWDMDWPETPQVVAFFDAIAKAEGTYEP